MTPEQLRAWVANSRGRQGLPQFVTEVHVLDAVATLLLVEGVAPQRAARGGRRRHQLVAPGDRHTVRVEGVASSDGGADGNAVNNGSDDRSLPVAS